MKPLFQLLAPLLLAALATACAASRTQTAQTSHQSAQTLTLQAEAGGQLDSLSAQLRRQAENRTESNRTLLVTAEGVPGQQTELRIAAQQLLDLPDGAQYAARRGRASVEARRQGDTIIVQGRCDSIARRCLYLEERMLRQRRSLDSLHRLLTASQHTLAQRSLLTGSRSTEAVQREQTRRPPATWHWWLLTGFLAGGAASALLTKTNPLKTIVSFIQKLF